MSKKDITLNEELKSLIIDNADKLNKIVDSVGQLLTINILKPEKYSSYKSYIGPELILPNCSITTATILDLKGYNDALIGVSCLHGSHVGSTSFFNELYPKKGKVKKI
jgi:hypothetical protein